jgi:serine/threonine protein kinase
MKKMFWELPKDEQIKALEAAFPNWARVCGMLETPHSRIFTLDYGSNSEPRYIVAKGVFLDPTSPKEQWKPTLKRVLREVQNSYKVCSHPFVNRIGDVKIINGIPFLVSEKKNQTLRDLIAGRKIALAEAFSISVQILHALEYCERRGIGCHQDLKPENIFLSSLRADYTCPPELTVDYIVRVADFELANAFSEENYPYGSRPYMAPEQYRRLDELSIPDVSKIDVFALGVILYEMMTGGYHPIGEETALVWPRPTAGKSNRWSREDKWKDWARRGSIDLPNHLTVPEPVLTVIKACICTDVSVRLSKAQAKKRILELLRIESDFDQRFVTLNLDHFDKLAQSSDDSEWPYRDELIEMVDRFFTEY